METDETDRVMSSTSAPGEWQRQDQLTLASKGAC
jgi:hypothetical protein